MSKGSERSWINWEEESRKYGYKLREVLPESVIIEFGGLLYKFKRRRKTFDTKLGIKNSIDKTKFLIKELESMWGSDDRYDFSCIEYKSYTEKVMVVCNRHGKFLSSPANLLKGKGCPSCGRESTSAALTKKFPDFEREANLVHNCKYVYKEDEFKNCTTETPILCTHHGVFYQKPSKHLGGQGCPECSLESKGYTRTAFEKACVRNSDGLGMLYVLTCHSIDDCFYKVGITSLSVRERYRKGGSMPYDFKILFTAVGMPSEVFDLEKHISRELRHQRHTPLKVFDGMTECISPCVSWVTMLEYATDKGLLVSTMDNKKHRRR